MAVGNDTEMRPRAATRRTALSLMLGAPLLGACAGMDPNMFGSVMPQQSPAAVGKGQVKVGVVLPLSAAGNAGVAAVSMKNAAEMAFTEFRNPNIQILFKDDAGTPAGALTASEQAIAEGAEIILGPLFAQSVPNVAAPAQARGIPVIAFSTDAAVAAPGVYLLSFLPESDVIRIVDYSAGTGKKSFGVLLPDNAYGTVVEAALKQAVAKRDGRIVALEKYGFDRTTPVRNMVQGLVGVDALFMADDGETVAAMAEALTASGANLRDVQVIGTGLWDNPRVFAAPALQGGYFAAPAPAGFRAFAMRYRNRYGSDPVRTATLAYDAVALVAALARTQGPERFSQQTLTNASGFAGIDGLFRFRVDGTNERGLAVMRVEKSGGQLVAGAPKVFGA